MNTSPDAVTIYDGQILPQPNQWTVYSSTSKHEKCGDDNNYMTGSKMSTDQLQQLVNEFGSEISEEEREIIFKPLFS